MENMSLLLLDIFLKKQKLEGLVDFIDFGNSVVVFKNDMAFSFEDMKIDVLFGIEPIVAVRYMQGFDYELDDALIDKSLGYRVYLESKKLI